LEKSPDAPAWKTVGDAPLRFVHRRTEHADVFFVVNRATWAVDIPVTFRIKDRTAELWDPDTGTIEPAAYEETADGVHLQMQLPPLASTFVVFRPNAIQRTQSRKKTESAPAPVVVEGPWKVQFPDGSGAPSSVTLSELKSWNESSNSGVRHFSGIATYRTSFSCSSSADDGNHTAMLDLGRVAEVCEVRLNGQYIGTGWHPPYRLDITDALRSGENQLEIRVANLWHNRIVGDAALPKQKRITRMVPESHYQRVREAKLVESGLIGPIWIDFGGK
jgi:hypothetical protein